MLFVKLPTAALKLVLLTVIPPHLRPREDAPAPESRPGSRGGSLYYSQVPSSQTGRTDAALGSNSTGDVPLKYDRQYGYIV